MSGEFCFGLLMLAGLWAAHHHQQTYGRTYEAALRGLGKRRDAVRRAMQGESEKAFRTAVYALRDAYNWELSQRQAPEERDLFLRFLALNCCILADIEWFECYLGPGGFAELKAETSDRAA